MIFWPSVISATQRRRWAAELERKAAARVTVRTAAALLRVDPVRFVAFLRGPVGLTVGLDTELPREVLAARLRGPGSG
jgi:hypothetical protein